MSGLVGNPFLLASAAGGATGYSISRSLRFNSSDSAYLSRTPASAGNRKTWTWAGWVKRSKLADYQRFFWATGECSIRFENDDTLRFSNYTGTFTAFFKTTAVYRDVSAWYHIVLVADTTNATASDRIRLYVNGERVTSFSSQTNPNQNLDLEINTANAHNIAGAGGSEYFSGYLADVHFIDGQALNSTSFGEFSATTGVWMPKAYSGGSYGTNGFHLDFSNNASAAALGTDTSGNGNTWTVNNISVGKTSITGPAIYASASVYTTVAAIVANATPLGNGGGSVSGKFLYVVMNDGGKVGTVPFSSGWSSLVRTHSYNPSTSSWANTGSFGTSEYNLFSYSDNGAWAAYDLDNNGPAGFMVFSGFNSGNTPSDLYTGTVPTLNTANFNTLSSFNTGDDSLVDVPVNGAQTDTGVGGEVRGNYCTLNPLINVSGHTFSNGNLQVVTSSSNYGTFASTVAAPPSGKWYAEALISATSGYPLVGIAGTGCTFGTTSYLGGQATMYAYYGVNGNKYNNGTSSSYGATYGAGDIIGIAYDADAGTITFYKNGVSQGQAYSSITSGSYYFAGNEFNSASGTQIWNFGQRPFAYTAPSGFKALNTANLPAPVVTKPSTVMDVKTYTGNGSTQTVSGLGFSPDFVWIKQRNNITSHCIFDAVRGTSSVLSSNNANSEDATNALSSFNSDGFGLLTPNTGSYAVNALNDTYVAWTWDAGSSTVTNTQGSISSQVRANASAGFSIVTYTGNGSAGATVGHGLNVAPQLLINKRRSSTGTTADWAVWHKSVADISGSSYVLFLNTTDAALSASNRFNSTAPTSSVFTLGNADATNYNGGTFVTYCFAPVAGYSSFGSYTGNGSADGPFVALSFRPRWVMVKRTDSTSQWPIVDAGRSPYNEAVLNLSANISDAEYTGYGNQDFLSNGFKLRTSATNWNASGGTYIYAAFAESPFQYARAR